MAKLKDLAMVKSVNSDNFVYTPPDAAIAAWRILVKVNVAYDDKRSASVSLPVLAAILRGLRRASPLGRIVIVENATSEKKLAEIYETLNTMDLLDKEMRMTSVNTMLMENYRNLSPEPVEYKTMSAPGYIRAYDCVITVGAFKKIIEQDESVISASTMNLYSFLPSDESQGRSINADSQLQEANISDVLKDVYFSIGHFFHGAVLDLTEKYSSADKMDEVAQPIGKVVWGDDMLAVDEVACKLADEVVPNYMTEIQRLRKILQKQ
jgi:uncharacterized protein DUF362